MPLINKLKAIADAIRSKTGKTSLLTIDEMITEISNLSVIATAHVSSTLDTANKIVSSVTNGSEE